MRIASILFFFATVFVALVGCSDQVAIPPELAVTAEETATPEVKALVDTSWPKVKQVCPGLARYAADLQFSGVDDNFAFAPANVQRIDIKFKVSDKPSAIPGNYFAQGHTCYFTVSRGGDSLSVSKSACAAICQDKARDPKAGALEVPL